MPTTPESYGLFGDLVAGGVTAAAGMEQAQRTEQLGENFQHQARFLGEELRGDTQFKPFGVTSSTGNVQVSDDGSINATLDPRMAGLQDQAFGGASDFLGDARIPLEARQQMIFDQGMNVLNPQIERQRANAAATAFNQGRTGITSNLYGGTGEQLAMEKAIAEQQADLLFRSRAQAANEQQAALAQAQGFQNMGFQPEQVLFNQLNPGIQTANLAQTGQIAGSNLLGQAAVAGLEGKLNAQHSANDLFARMMTGAGNVAGSAIGQIGRGLFDAPEGSSFGDILGNILF